MPVTSGGASGSAASSAGKAAATKHPLSKAAKAQAKASKKGSFQSRVLEVAGRGDDVREPGRQEPAPEVTCAQLMMKKKECESCNQHTHMSDADSPGGKDILQWAKFGKDGKGAKQPTGRECYACFDTRRRFYGQAELDQLLSLRANTEEESRFRRLRRDKVSGENLLRDEAQMSSSDVVNRVTSSYDDAFDIGTFVPIQAYAAKKNLDLSIREDEQKLTDHIRQVFNVEVGVGATGELGVFATELEAGEYKYKRGMKKSDDHNRIEGFGDGLAARERMQKLAEGRFSIGMAPPPIDADAEMGEEDEDDSQAVSRQGRSSHLTGARLALACHGPSSTQFASTMIAGRSSFAASSASGTASQERESFDGGAGERAKQQKKGSNTDKEKADESETPRALGRYGAAKKQKKGSSADEIVEANRSVLADAAAQCSPRQLWDRKVRHRDLETTLSKLSSRASKLAHMIGNTDASQLADSMFNLSTSIEEHKIFFEQIRNTPSDLILSPMSERHSLLFSKLDEELRSSIIVSVAFSIMDSSDPVSMATAVKVAHHQDDNILSMKKMGRIDTEDCRATILNAQQSIMTPWMDKLVKKCSVPDFTKTMKMLGIGGMLMPNFDIGSLDTSGIGMVGGWASQLCIDLHALAFMAEVLEGKRDESLSRQTRSRMGAFLSAKASLSVRLRTYIRVGGIGGSNNAKVAWDTLEKEHESVKAVGPERLAHLSMVLRKYIDGIETIKKKEDDDEGTTGAGKADELYEQVCMLEEDADLKSACQEFAAQVDTIGFMADECAEQEMIVLKQDFLKAIDFAVCTVMHFHGNFEKLVDKLFFGDDSQQCENLTAALEWLQIITGTLAHFDIPDSMAIVTETQKWCTMFKDIAGLKSQAEAKSPEAKLAAWSSIWQQVQKISKAKKTAKTAFDGLDKFCQKARMADVGRPIVDFTLNLVGDFKRVTPALCSTADELRGMLPPRVGELVDSSRTEALVFQTADLVDAGQTVGVLQLLAALRRTSSTDVCAEINAKVEFTKACDKLKKEFADKLSETLAKCDLTEVVDFQRRYSIVQVAVAAWDFSNKANSWMVATTPDAKVEVDTKMAEGFVLAYHTNVRVATDLHAAIDAMFWLDKEKTEAIKVAKTTMTANEALYKEVKALLSIMVLVNAIEAGVSLDSATKYVTGKLKQSLLGLHPVLREKHLAARLLKSIGKDKKPVADESQDTVGDASTCAPDSSCTFVSEADTISEPQSQPLAKKLRRLSSTFY